MGDDSNSSSDGRGARRSNRSSRRGGGRPDGRRGDQPDRTAYAFSIEVAEELLALLRDDPGEPDEELLDEARHRLDVPLSPKEASRDQLLLWMSHAERDEVVTLLEEDLDESAPRADAKVVRHVAHHLERRLAQRLSQGR